jgi:ubiquitin-conjugating enzyme E2 S
VHGPRDPLLGGDVIRSTTTTTTPLGSPLLSDHTTPHHTDDTPYVGGTFHVKLVLSQDFPNSPPRGFFLTRIYHPNVSTSGDICVNTLKKDWSATVTLSHVLQVRLGAIDCCGVRPRMPTHWSFLKQVIRCLLIVPFPESSLNDEAGKQFMESYEDYAKRARLLTSVHAMRKAGAAAGTGTGTSTSGGTGGGAEKAAADSKEAAEDGEGKGAAAGGGGGEAGAGVLGSPNVASMAKRKAGPGGAGQKDAAADKRNNKKRGLKRL